MKTILSTILLLMSLQITPSLVFADEKIVKEIKYRQSAMMFMRWNMGTIKKQVVKKSETYNMNQVIASATVIEAISNSGLGKLFGDNTKQGTGWKETRIKPEFFEQPNEVRKRVSKFKKEASALAQVAKTGNIEEIKDQFEKTFKACKGCHKKFRKKQPK